MSRRRWPGCDTGVIVDDHCFMHRPLARAAGRRSVATLLLAGALLAGCTSTPQPSPPSSSQSPEPAPGVNPTASRSVSLPTSSAPITAAVASPAESGSKNEVPEVVGLAWLGKRPNTPGIQIAVPGGTRWQSQIPGEYAVIHGKSREWFGADGSAVGCVSDTACVGVGAAGYTAVLQDGKVRLVYRPDGQPVGRFQKNGDRQAGAALPTLTAAVAATGVDLAALLDASTSRIPFAGGITGDPHVLTAGGRRYSTQLTGQYQARSGDPQRAVQVRLEPLPHRVDVSVVTAVAVGRPGSVLEYTANGVATLAGRTLPAPQPFHQEPVPGGAQIGLWAADSAGAGHAAILWPDGSSVVMSASAVLGMTVVVSAPETPGVSGLFGVGGTDPAHDLQDRQGASLDPDTVTRDWLVEPASNMFTEQIEPIIGFPSAAPAVPRQAAAFAEKSCRAVGLTGADDLAACEFDVGLTGDNGFAAGHAAMVEPAVWSPAPQLAARWPALQLASSTQRTALPEIIDAEFAAGHQRAYEVTVTERGPVGLEFVSGCADNPPAYPPPQVAAVRMFDAHGHPVSKRLAPCGQPATPTLSPGHYLLVVAGPAAGPAQEVRLQVNLP